MIPCLDGRVAGLQAEILIARRKWQALALELESTNNPERCWRRAVLGAATQPHQADTVATQDSMREDRQLHDEVELCVVEALLARNQLCGVARGVAE